MKRLFAAIKVNPERRFREIFYKMKEDLKYDKIKWVNINNIHITLKFFGETEEDRIADIISGLEQVANNHKCFDLKIEQTGIFGSSYKPKVIWFGIDKNKELLRLAGDIHSSMAEIGFLQDRQNFVPHLTVGRIKFIDNKRLFQTVIDKYSNLKIQQQEVTQFHLYESILRREGPQYNVVERFLLSG